MVETLQIGKRFIPLEHIVLLEPFDTSAQPRLLSDRPFQTRLVLIDRHSVLSEQPLQDIAEQNGFRILPEDGLATNPAVHFTVEGFAPSEGFTPTKPYKSRLLWRGPGGAFESRLLLSPPETVLAIAVRGEEGERRQKNNTGKPRRGKRQRTVSLAPV